MSAKDAVGVATLGLVGHSGVRSAVGGLWNDISGTTAMAEAQQNAANATLAQQRADREQALKFAAPSDQEMQLLEQAISVNSQDIARKQKLLDSADPAFIEAGKQALALMTGAEATTLNPLKNQIARQRKAVENTLAAQLGPDYATSSAGLQALSAFDAQAADTLANQQNQTLGQFMNWTGMSQQYGNQQNNIANAGSLAAQRGNIGVRQANAIQGFQIDPALSQVGNIAQAQGYQDMFNTAVGGGMAYFGAGGGKAGMTAIAGQMKKTSG